MPNTREKLIELLESAFESFIDDPYCIPDEREFADHLIANGVTLDNKVASSSKQAASSEWISVKDRLPDTDEKCLLCMESRITKYRWVTIGYYHTNYDEYVTHWMPLPEPPKGE